MRGDKKDYTSLDFLIRVLCDDYNANKGAATIDLQVNIYWII